MGPIWIVSRGLPCCLTVCRDQGQSCELYIGTTIYTDAVGSDLFLGPYFCRMWSFNYEMTQFKLVHLNHRDQARGATRAKWSPWGPKFRPIGTQGEVGVSLKKKKKKFFFFFFRETHFHSVTTQMQAVVTLSDNLLPLHRVSPSIKWQ